MGLFGPRCGANSCTDGTASSTPSSRSSRAAPTCRRALRRRTSHCSASTARASRAAARRRRRRRAATAALLEVEAPAALGLAVELPGGEGDPLLRDFVLVLAEDRLRLELDARVRQGHGRDAARRGRSVRKLAGTSSRETLKSSETLFFDGERVWSGDGASTAVACAGASSLAAARSHAALMRRANVASSGKSPFNSLAQLSRAPPSPGWKINLQVLEWYAYVYDLPSTSTTPRSTPEALRRRPRPAI